MKNGQLLSTIAASLLLSAGAAFAQAPTKDNGPASAAPAPAAQQSAPAEKMAPNMKAGEKEKNAQSHKAPETTGQAPAASDAGKSGAAEKSMDKDKGAADKGPAKNPASTTSGQNTSPMSPNRAESPASSSPKSSQTSDPNAAKSSQTTTQQGSSTTTGQGSAAGAAKLSTEQRTKITSVFKQQKVERVEPSKLNISINVGTRVPERVHFYPIPQEVVVIYPEWRGYDYIMVGDQIVIIDPRSHEIVAILDA